MAMKLEQLEQLIEIDKQKSIGKAAKSLYIAQSTLSGSLASLEEELGVQLFRRTASGAVPTQEGQKVLQLAKVTLDSVEQILNVGKQETELYGSVTVYIGQGYSFLAADLLREFHKKHPRAELDLQIVTPDQQMEHLISTENVIALAVMMDPMMEYLNIQ